MDVLFTEKENKVNYDFKGRLSFSWPKLAGHKELNWGDESYDPLFSYGFGISYGDVTITELFDEEIDIDNLKQLNPNLFFTKGKLNTPWQFLYTEETLDWQPLDTQIPLNTNSLII